MTEMLIPSPSSTHRHERWETGFTDFKEKLGERGRKGGAKKKLKSQEVFSLSSTLQSKGFLFYFSAQYLPYLT